MKNEYKERFKAVAEIVKNLPPDRVKTKEQKLFASLVACAFYELTEESLILLLDLHEHLEEAKKRDMEAFGALVLYNTFLKNYADLSQVANSKGDQVKE